MKHYHPCTLDELVDILETIITKEVIDGLRDIDNDQLLAQMQLSLEEFVRTSFVIQNDNRSALYADCGRDTPHDVAQLAIWHLWRRLKPGQSGDMT
ncbi:MAG: hypothetical protein GY792_05830 [Gammaproteobacteria bacterium]|nr:hypothetical protein [Gammaproteobacteria bacterium]